MMSPERFLESQRVCRCSDTLMFVFDRAVPDEHRDAVTLTTWAAETHAAQGECAIEASPLGWLDSCVQTLAKLGWVTRERALAPRDAAASEALDDAAARMLTTQLGNDEAARCLLARLQSLGDWPAWPRWVGTVTRDDDAMPVLRTVLLLPVPPDGDAPDSEPDMGGTGADDVRPQRFQVSAWVATLNWPMFEVVRPVLLRRLGELTRAQALNNARHEARGAGALRGAAALVGSDAGSCGALVSPRARQAGRRPEGGRERARTGRLRCQGQPRGVCRQR